jgi:hypothetical protein
MERIDELRFEICKDLWLSEILESNMLRLIKNLNEFVGLLEHEHGDSVDRSLDFSKAENGLVIE